MQDRERKSALSHTRDCLKKHVKRRKRKRRRRRRKKFSWGDFVKQARCFLALPLPVSGLSSSSLLFSLRTAQTLHPKYSNHTVSVEQVL